MDPYDVLGVPATASDAELRAAYRRAVQREHPDHNGGSPEAASRFEAVQEAYAEIRRLRVDGASARPGGASGTTARPPHADPAVEARLAAMESELRAAREARERAERAAREAAAAARAAAEPERPSDEELGYIETDDSFGRILADARDELLGAVREKPPAARAADLLDEVAAALRGERPKRSP